MKVLISTVDVCISKDHEDASRDSPSSGHLPDQTRFVRGTSDVALPRNGSGLHLSLASPSRTVLKPRKF